MNSKKLKELNKILANVEETPEIMEELTKDANIKKYLADIFSDTKEVKYSSIINISQNDLVNDLVYNYAQEHLEIVDDSKELDTSGISSFALYLNDISYFPLLSKEEEKEIATKAKYGTKKEKFEARNKLVSHNLRLVINVAKKYVGRGVYLEDLIQEGNRGLIMASERFDVDKGFAFSTYAIWWIRQTITRYIDNNSRNIRIPVHRLQFIEKIKKLETEYMDKYNENPTLHDLADYMAKEKFDEYFKIYKEKDYDNATDIEKLMKNSLMLPESKRKYYEDEKYANVKKNKNYNEKAIIKVDKYQRRYNLNFKKDVEDYKRDYCLIDIISPVKKEIENEASLNAKPINYSDGEKENELMNFVPDTNKSIDPVLTTENDSFWSLIQEIISKDTILSPRDKEVARLRFGIPNNKQMTSDEISEIFTKKDKETIEKDIKEAEKIVKNNPEEANYLMEGKEEHSILTPYQRELMELKYGIPPTGMKTKKAIGEIMSINPMRVRDIESKILRRLRNPITAKKIKDFNKK